MARSNDQVSSESSERITFVRGSLLHSCPTDSMQLVCDPIQQPTTHLSFTCALRPFHFCSLFSLLAFFCFLSFSFSFINFLNTLAKLNGKSHQPRDNLCIHFTIAYPWRWDTKAGYTCPCIGLIYEFSNVNRWQVALVAIDFVPSTCHWQVNYYFSLTLCLYFFLFLVCCCYWCWCWCCCCCCCYGWCCFYKCC